MGKYLVFGRLGYDPDTGVLTWLSGPRRGKRAGCACIKNGKTYREIRLGRKLYLEHRLIFALIKGYWPIGVDHENGTGDDNRWINLREANQSQNMHNYGMRADNTSGVKGVVRHGKFWSARIKSNGKVYQKKFKLFDDAVKHRQLLEKQHAKEFAWVAI